MTRRSSIRITRDRRTLRLNRLHRGARRGFVDPIAYGAYCHRRACCDHCDLADDLAADGRVCPGGRADGRPRRGRLYKRKIVSITRVEQQELQKQSLLERAVVIVRDNIDHRPL